MSNNKFSGPDLTISWSSIHLPVDPSSGDNSCGPDNSLNIIHEKLENLEVQGTSSSIVTATAVSTDGTNSVCPVKGMEM